MDSVIIACAIGSLAAAVLLVNNFRDLATDEKVHKLTLTHYLGRENSCLLYAMLVLCPFTIPLALTSIDEGKWLVLAALPLALNLLYRFYKERPGPAFNQILARTAQLQLLYAVLLSVSLINPLQ